ncbi:MAG: ATP synthase subunit delta [Deltaproteobacteria bacterium ADurb.Bin058]|nr:MAG: ATP synthase subunit delta [Deltaproteobacteria bacterium ADurb.Bin058]
MQDERAGVAQALVESAGPISDMQAAQISQAVGAVVNRRLQITKKLDPTLLSGVRVTVGDRVFDLTTRSYLETLRNRLLENR